MSSESSFSVPHGFRGADMFLTSRDACHIECSTALRMYPGQTSLNQDRRHPFEGGGEGVVKPGTVRKWFPGVFVLLCCTVCASKVVIVSIISSGYGRGCALGYALLDVKK